MCPSEKRGTIMHFAVFHRGNSYTSKCIK